MVHQKVWGQNQVFWKCGGHGPHGSDATVLQSNFKALLLIILLLNDIDCGYEILIIFYYLATYHTKFSYVHPSDWTSFIVIHNQKYYLKRLLYIFSVRNHTLVGLDF